MASGLLEVCVCPRCGGTLGEAPEGATCSGCQTVFPALQGIPCLFADAPRQMADWQRQLGVYGELLQRGITSMGEQLQAFDLLPAARQRVELLRTAAIDNGERVMSMLRAAGLHPSSPAETASGARAQEDLEAGFTLIEYYDHILRDWAWDEDSTENVRARDLVLEALGDQRQLGRLLVLGAGACRLAYDLHMRCKPALTVALDISPLFLVAAKRVMFGTGLELQEFPAFPADSASVCVQRQLRAPAGAPPRFHLLLADAFAAPLRAGAFDTVLTPWFIDIVPVDIRRTLSVIHPLLAPGGRWINHGPLNYQKQHPHSQRYTLDELYTLIRLAGFSPGEARAEQMPLLASRASANARLERVITFAARKEEISVPDPGTEHPPSAGPPPWLLFSHLPIPRFAGLDRFRTDHPVMAFVARGIDGAATLGDLAARMIKEHGARPDAALDGTRALVNLLHQECRKI